MVNSYPVDWVCVGHVCLEIRRQKRKKECAAFPNTGHIFLTFAPTLTQHFRVSYNLFGCMCLCMHMHANMCVCVCVCMRLCVIFSHLTLTTDLSKGLTVQLSKHRHADRLTDLLKNVFIWLYSNPWNTSSKSQTLYPSANVHCFWEKLLRVVEDKRLLSVFACQG